MSNNGFSKLVEETGELQQVAGKVLAYGLACDDHPDRAESLREEFGDSIVEETTTFSFDETMIEKYGEVLSQLIEQSSDIDEADKDKIIKAVSKFTIAKGTIDVMKGFGKINEVMDAIKPVVMLKGPEVIKG